MMILPHSRARLDYQGYLFDLDGVLWLGDTAIAGAKETLRILRAQGKKLLFVSNTSSRSRQQCLDQFAQMDMTVLSEELFLASEATAQHLAELKPGAITFVMGSAGLIEEVTKAGLRARLDLSGMADEIDFVVIGKDKDLDYQRLTFAMRAIRAGAKFVAVNCDITVPGNDGLEPGAGAIAVAIASLVGREPDITVGKPGTLLLEKAIKSAGLSAAECAMVGDTLEADIAAGNRLGMATILVLSGNATEIDAKNTSPELIPDLILPTIASLV